MERAASPGLRLMDLAWLSRGVGLSPPGWPPSTAALASSAECEGMPERWELLPIHMRHIMVIPMAILRLTYRLTATLILTRMRTDTRTLKSTPKCTLTHMRMATGYRLRTRRITLTVWPWRWGWWVILDPRQGRHTERFGRQSVARRRVIVAAGGWDNIRNDMKRG